MDGLSRRWSELHARTLPLISALAAAEPPSAADAASRLPPGTLDGALLATVLAREASERGAQAVELARLLDELEAVLEEMHALSREARVSVANTLLESAADRGPSGRDSTPSDSAISLSAPLRCYEAELALKRWTAEAVQRRVPLPPKQVQSLLVAWQCQPMLEPVDAMQRAAASTLGAVGSAADVDLLARRLAAGVAVT